MSRDFDISGLAVEPGEESTILRLSGEVALSPADVDDLRRRLKPYGAEEIRRAQVQQIVLERRLAQQRAAKARRRNTNAPTPVERLAIERDMGCCVRCGFTVVQGERGADWSLQHRSNRGMGGSQRAGVNTVPNLIVLCGSAVDGCHGWVESHNAEALERGWSISKFADPLLEPVFVAALDRKVWLTANGKYSDEAPGAVA